MIDYIKLARQANLGTALVHNSIEGERIFIEGADWHDEIERFAELVQAAERERMCAAIKAADDKASEGDYMLDSDDCISVVRGTWNP
jgi:hypothetical protein